MDRRDRPERRWTDSSEEHDAFGGGSDDREHEVVGAYDDIDGMPMFIVAEIDSDHAWIAISEDAELDLVTWR